MCLLGLGIGCSAIGTTQGAPNKAGSLPSLEVMDLINKPLEFGNGVPALFGSHPLIDGQGHGLGILAYLADGVLIGLRSGLIVVHEHRAELSGDLFGSPGLMQEGHELLPAL